MIKNSWNKYMDNNTTLNAYIDDGLYHNTGYTITTNQLIVDSSNGTITVPNAFTPAVPAVPASAIDALEKKVEEVCSVGRRRLG